MKKTAIKIREWFGRRYPTYIIWMAFWTPLVMVLLTAHLILKLAVGISDALADAWEETGYGVWWRSFSFAYWGDLS